MNEINTNYMTNEAYKDYIKAEELLARQKPDDFGYELFVQHRDAMLECYVSYLKLESKS